MYKQRCVGAQGALMPAIFICACGMILYSATDACVRALQWPLWAFAISAAVFVFATLVIHRYTRVEMEYVWFSDELVVRRHENGRIARLVVRQQSICGMRDRTGTVGRCAAAKTHNCCATLSGRLAPCTVYYRDDDGRARRMLLQPAPELRALLWSAANKAAGGNAAAKI